MVLEINDRDLIENGSLNQLDINRFVKKKILLIGLYNHNLFSIRILHSIIEKYAQVKTVFFKRSFYVSGDKEDVPSEIEYEHLMKLIKEYDPEMIGISLRSFFFPVAKEISERIRKISGALIVWGGTHPIICPEECIKYADMVCVCEGEIPIQNLFEKKSLDGFWINYGGKIYRSSKRILTENLDALPVPNLKNENKYAIDKDKISLGDPVQDMRVYGTQASRGCPFNCAYCINSNLKELYHGQKFLRLRSVDSVINELKTIKKESKSVRRIFLYDEIFALGNKEWIKEFVKMYKREIDLPFALEYRPDMVPQIEDSLMLLKDAGLDNIVVGLEGSERLRKEVYLRNISDEQMLESQRVLKKLGLFVTYNMIVKNPFETIEDLKKVFELVIKLPRPFSFHIFHLTNFPKTELTKRFISEGIIKEDDFHDHKNAYIFVPKKDNEEAFWINLIGLSSKEFIPKKFLIFLSRRKYFIKHQFFIYFFTRVSNLVKFMTDGFRWASKEKFSYKILVTGFKEFKNLLVNYR